MWQSCRCALIQPHTCACNMCIISNFVINLQNSKRILKPNYNLSEGPVFKYNFPGVAVRPSLLSSVTPLVNLCVHHSRRISSLLDCYSMRLSRGLMLLQSWTVAYLRYGRHGSRHGRHFDGGAKIPWPKLRFVTCSSFNFHFAPQTTINCKTASTQRPCLMHMVCQHYQELWPNHIILWQNMMVRYYDRTRACPIYDLVLLTCFFSLKHFSHLSDCPK